MSIATGASERLSHLLHFFTVLLSRFILLGRSTTESGLKPGRLQPPRMSSRGTRTFQACATRSNSRECQAATAVAPALRAPLLVSIHVVLYGRELKNITSSV